MSDDLAGRMTPDGHQLLQRVYFEDTDFSGRVYHARYLHFMERGRSDYLRLLGVHHRELAGNGLAFAVSRMEIEFLRPASIDDILRITTSPQAASGARIRLLQELARERDVLVRARVTVVLVQSSGRPARLPPALREAFGAPALR
jgi:acyl-CoA thioester hydrolase